MRTMTKLVGLLLLVPLTTYGAEQTDNYGYAEVVSIPDGDTSAVHAYGSAAVNRHIRFFGSYTRSSLDNSLLDVDVDQVTAGIGYTHNFSDDVKVHLDLGALHTSVTSDFGDASDQGGIGAVTLRWAPMAKLEIEPSVTYAWIDSENSTNYRIRASYWLNPIVGIGASVFDSDDADVGFGIHLRIGPQRKTISNR